MIKIVQPLNNNVVMGYDRKKGEVIIIGTGIGFRAKKGDQVDQSKIQKMFITGENKNRAGRSSRYAVRKDKKSFRKTVI